jgi:hypothetical protein
MFYSAKRQQYLIDQGYTFKIVTHLAEKAAVDAVKHKYAYSTPEDDRRLLRIVLTSEAHKNCCMLYFVLLQSTMLCCSLLILCTTDTN